MPSRTCWALWLAGCTSTNSPITETGGQDTASPDTGAPDTDAEPIVPLYDASTPREPDLIVDRGDAVVTYFSDRGRDRHAREDEFQSYDHYLPLYWNHRTARFMFVDTVASGGQSIAVSFVTEWRLSIAEFRAWYAGYGTVAQYHGNYGPLFEEDGPGSYDHDHTKISEDGNQYRYTYTITAAIQLDGTQAPLAVGQFMELEASQFLLNVPEGRANYYGTTFLYAVGSGGMVPWYAAGDFSEPGSDREDSRKLDEAAWLGGRTTLPYMYSDEPDNHFMQMATNLSSVNGQPFVLGRRVHHTDMLTGSHDESDENGTFDELIGMAGPLYANRSCDACHQRNGRAPVPALGAPLDRWGIVVADQDGSPHPALGRALQPASVHGSGEGSVSISAWTEDSGLRTPQYAFEGITPERYSARLAPQLVGMGLIDAIAEDSILAWEDADDADGDGISGVAQRIKDPETGDIRLGRFGWKAGTTSLRHQLAAALNADMGVMTSVLPDPDCGDTQKDCGPSGPELSDEHLENLTKYVALLGIRARRGIDDPAALRGEALFGQIGCDGCHRAAVTTSPHHPLAELRGQRIHPYTDLLLHDMGEGLADNLGEGDASGAEWRTAPLWGIGNSPCVTGGVEGVFQQQTCAPNASYLHDGRARTLREAIDWHGGEAAHTRDAFDALPQVDQDALITFLETL